MFVVVDVVVDVVVVVVCCLLGILAFLGSRSDHQLMESLKVGTKYYLRYYKIRSKIRERKKYFGNFSWRKKIENEIF